MDVRRGDDDVGRARVGGHARARWRRSPRRPPPPWPAAMARTLGAVDQSPPSSGFPLPAASHRYLTQGAMEIFGREDASRVAITGDDGAPLSTGATVHVEGLVDSPHPTGRGRAGLSPRRRSRPPHRRCGGRRRAGSSPSKIWPHTGSCADLRCEWPAPIGPLPPFPLRPWRCRSGSCAPDHGEVAGRELGAPTLSPGFPRPWRRSSPTAPPGSTARSRPRKR